jgi:hypothetical protein
MDVFTLMIELVGLTILCLWIYIPVQEFKEILAAVRKRRERGEGNAEHGGAGE